MQPMFCKHRSWGSSIPLWMLQQKRTAVISNYLKTLNRCSTAQHNKYLQTSKISWFSKTLIKSNFFFFNPLTVPKPKTWIFTILRIFNSLPEFFIFLKILFLSDRAYRDYINIFFNTEYHCRFRMHLFKSQKKHPFYASELLVLIFRALICEGLTLNGTRTWPQRMILSHSELIFLL